MKPAARISEIRALIAKRTETPDARHWQSYLHSSIAIITRRERHLLHITMQALVSEMAEQAPI